MLFILLWGKHFVGGTPLTHPSVPCSFLLYTLGNLRSYSSFLKYLSTALYYKSKGRTKSSSVIQAMNRKNLKWIVFLFVSHSVKISRKLWNQMTHHLKRKEPSSLQPLKYPNQLDCPWVLCVLLHIPKSLFPLSHTE
jgi:hypothetical protein